MRIAFASILSLTLAACSGTGTGNATAGGGSNVEGRVDAGLDATSPGDASVMGDGGSPDSCGSSGDVNQRIASCSSKRCVSSGNSTIVDCGGPHDFEWQLVARERLTEVWRDVTTGVVWGGDHLTEPSDQAGALRGCTQAGRYEAGLAVAFRLPAIEEFELAASHGIRKVVQGFDDLVWWSSSTTPEGKAWTYSEGERRTLDPKAQDEYFRYRCVAGL